MKLIKPNWYGLDHEKACEKFEGELTYLNTFCLKGMYQPCAVYHNAKPNREKNHKDYLLLFMNYRESLINNDENLKGTLTITGIDQADMDKERYQSGIWCPECDEVIYSVMRHDYRRCSCGKVMVDGGKDYLRCSVEGVIVKIDLLTDELIVLRGAGEE